MKADVRHSPAGCLTFNPPKTVRLESRGGYRISNGRLGFVLLAFIGVLFLSAPYCADRRGILSGLNDFPAFYCAPRLLASHALYTPLAMDAEQARVLGRTNPNIQFVRPPFVALFAWPFSGLPFQWAYAAWQLCSFGALVGFLWLWPAKRMMGLLLCCWFPPTAASFANGQEVPFLLLWIAVGAWLLKAGRPFLAGAVLSLCAAKFHLLLFIPVVLIACRLWRTTLGMIAGGSALLAVSFMTAGWNWPVQLYRAWMNPSVHPSLSGSLLAGLRAIGLNGAAFVAVAATIAVISGAIVWICAKRLEFPAAMGAALAAGTLTAYHVYLQDYLLWLPLLSLVLTWASPGSGGTPLNQSPQAPVDSQA